MLQIVDTTADLKTKHPIFLFDSVCILCEGAVNYVLGHEKDDEIIFVAIQSTIGRKLAEEHDIDPDVPESFIFFENGKPHFKSDGVIALFSRMRGPSRFVKLGKPIPRFMRDWLYTIVARNRYKIFGKTDQCIVLNPENKDRFIL